MGCAQWEMLSLSEHRLLQSCLSVHVGDTDLPARGGGFLSQRCVYFCVWLSFQSSTLCLVSLWKSWVLPGCCSQGPSEGPGWSWGRVASGALSSGRPLLFPQESAACLCSGRPRWPACCCTVPSPGEGPPLAPRTTLGGPVMFLTTVPKRQPERDLQGREGRSPAFLGPRVLWVGQPVGALTQDPHPLSTSINSEPFDGDTVPVTKPELAASPWSVAFTIHEENCDAHRCENSLAVISVVTEYRKSFNKSCVANTPCGVLSK